MPAERLAWYRLARAVNVGPVTFWRLIERFGTASEVLDHLPALAKAARYNKPIHVPSKTMAEDELGKAVAAGMAVQIPGDKNFPPLLQHLTLPPPLIYSKGNCKLWQRPAIAVIGSRHASMAGVTLAASLARELAADGFIIVSGLARGIDGSAHRAALPSGTAAVLAGGLDVIYPPEHADLYRQIAADGVLICESPPGFQPRSQDFPRRNRLISGASLGVVVIEAAEKSGSLITARFALEQNREIFAVPGHPLDPRAAGTNTLLKRGATLTACAGDITEVLKPSLAAWADILSAAKAANLGAAPLFRHEPQPDQLCLREYWAGHDAFQMDHAVDGGGDETWEILSDDNDGDDDDDRAGDGSGSSHDNSSGSGHANGEGHGHKFHNPADQADDALPENGGKQTLNNGHVPQTPDCQAMDSPKEPLNGGHIHTPSQTLADGQLLSYGLQNTATEDEPSDDKLRTRILAALNTTPVAIDDLARHLSVEARDLQVELLTMELSGLVDRLDFNFVVLRVQPGACG
jgi:DNA processing protein